MLSTSCPTAQQILRGIQYSHDTFTHHVGQYGIVTRNCSGTTRQYNAALYRFPYRAISLCSLRGDSAQRYKQCKAGGMGRHGAARLPEDDPYTAARLGKAAYAAGTLLLGLKIPLITNLIPPGNDHQRRTLHAMNKLELPVCNEEDEGSVDRVARSKSPASLTRVVWSPPLVV